MIYLKWSCSWIFSRKWIYSSHIYTGLNSDENTLVFCSIPPSPCLKYKTTNYYAIKLERESGRPLQHQHHPVGKGEIKRHFPWGRDVKSHDPAPPLMKTKVRLSPNICAKKWTQVAPLQCVEQKKWHKSNQPTNPTLYNGSLGMERRKEYTYIESKRSDHQF